MRRSITATRTRNKDIIAVVAIVAIVVAFFSQIALAVRTMKEAGMGFFEYAQLSDFGLFLAMWSYNSAWVLITLALFVGGALLFFSSRKR